MTIRKIEAGSRRPSRQIAERLADCLEIAPADHAIFIKVARAHVSVEQLADPMERTVQVSIVPATRTFSTSTPTGSEELMHSTQAPDNFPPLITHANRPHNLPAQPTTLVGRDEEMETIFALLRRADVRLVTLCGPGGIGKTRLALQAAEAQLEMFTHGVYFVSLAPVSSADFLVSAIANAIRFSLYGTGDPRIQLLTYLREKKLLLVLDNFEHLLAGVELVVDLIQQAPGVNILVTSRERLNLLGEWVIELSGLSFPKAEQGAHSESYSAVQMFLQSARRVHMSLVFSGEELPCVVRICQLVEGMPLGIELASAWTRVISCEEIAHEIKKSLEFLATSSQGVQQRHRSMRAVFDHSWNLLTPEEQRVFRQLSVFRGGFRRDAAEQIIGASLTHLAALVDKSLLRRSTAGRYDMHELIRQYATMKLQETPGEQVTVLDRHCNYYTEFLHQRRRQLRGEFQRDALEEMRAEIENVRQAWRWAVTRRKVAEIKKSLQSLLDFYDTQGWFQEGKEAFRLAMEELENVGQGTEEQVMQHGVVLGQLLAGQGWLSLASGNYERAVEASQTSLSLLRRHGAREELMNPLTTLGIAAHFMGDYTGSQRFLQESLTIQRATGDQWGEGWSIGNLGMVSYALGQYRKARDLMNEALTLFKTLGDQRMIALSYSFLSMVTCSLGEYAEAERLSREGLMLSREIRHPWGTAIALCNLGAAAYFLGKYAEAQELLQESLGLFKLIEEPWGTGIALSYLANGGCALGAYSFASQYALEALEIATKAKLVPMALDVLVVQATIRMNEGEMRPAFELLGPPLQHPGSTSGTKERALHLLAEMESHLAPEEIADLKEQWAARTFEEIVEKVLNAKS